MRTNGHRIAGAIWMLAMTGCIVLPTRSWADAPSDSATAAQVRTAVIRGPDGRTHPGNPILIPGTETRATRLGPPPPRRSIAFRLGSVGVSIYGFSVAAPHATDTAGAIRDASTTVVHNAYAGGGMEVELTRPARLYVEGGRVALLEPVDVLGAGHSSSQYWTTSAGLEFRF
jgi:hypothetical protein